MNPTRGDWSSFALGLVDRFDLKLTVTEIKNMKSSQFKQIVKEKMQNLAFFELQEKQRSREKGRKIVYRTLSMADYLLPDSNLTVKEKTDIFSLRVEMNENPHNFGIQIFCDMGCLEIQDNSHIINCPKLNNEGQQIDIEDILNGSLPMKVRVLRRYEENIEKRNMKKQ